MSKGPCDNCGSSDANHTFPNGATYCYSCHAKTGTLPKDGQPDSPAAEAAVPPKTRRGGGKLIPVETRALVKRGIREDTCAKWGYGVGTYRGETVQVAQYRNAEGEVVGQKIRTANKEFTILGEIKSAGLYGQWLWRDTGRMIVVVEGEIDALTVSQLQDNKWPVVSLPNGAQSGPKAISQAVEYLEKFDKVVFMLDNDEPGQKAAVACAEVLSPGKAYIAALPLKDANDMLQAGRGKEVIDAIWGARVYRPDGVVQGDDVWEQITREDLSVSQTWPHSGLNEKTYGIRQGEVVTLVAGTGAGKSTLCRELAMHLILSGETVGYIALEENVRRSALGLLSILANTPLHQKPNSEIVTPELRALWKRIQQRVVFYDHFGSIDSKNLLAKIRYMVKALGVKYVVLDHLSIVVSGMDIEADERRTIDQTMTALASMAQEMNVCLILVSHLKRTEGKPHEQGKAVTLSDLRGSHSISQLSHTVVSVERDQQDEAARDVSTLRVLKCRHTGNTGVAGEMIYDKETGRLKESKTEFENDNSGDFTASEEMRGLRGADQPALETKGETVSPVRAARRKGKVEPAVEEHGLRAVGEGNPSV